MVLSLLNRIFSKLSVFLQRIIYFVWLLGYVSAYHINIDFIIVENKLKYFVFLISGKPRGLRTARKHVNHRRDQRWADKDYKKAHLGTRWKANPFGGASHAKGIVLEKV